MTEEQKINITFTFAPGAMIRLDALKEATNAIDRAQTIRQALRLYEWFINEVHQGDSIVIVNNQNQTLSRFAANLLLNAMEETNDTDGNAS